MMLRRSSRPPADARPLGDPAPTIGTIYRNMKTNLFVLEGRPGHRIQEMIPEMNHGP